MPSDAPHDAFLRELEACAPALTAWYQASARPLPWRHDRRPYAVWISEVMLQQTRASTATAYYRAWMRRFPDIATLAAAEESEVLRAWEGLGYYRRARLAHRTARHVAGELGGAFPNDEAGLRALPGVGPYTAAAVAALAFGVPTVAVDGNVRRVGSRLTARPRPRDRDLRRELARLLPAERPERGTEALIELGATVCTPVAPACHACPLASACRALGEGHPEDYPAPAPRASVPTRRRFARLHLDEARLYLVRRPPRGLLGGMWGPPQQERAPKGRVLPTVRHAYTHFRLDLVPVVVPATDRPSSTEGDADGASEGKVEHTWEAGWIHVRDLAELPMSRVDRAVIRRLREAGLLASEA